MLTADWWLGAVIGAVASIAVAVRALRRTPRHVREQFLAQLGSERMLGLEQRRPDAFGDVAGHLGRFTTMPSHEETRVATTSVCGARSLSEEERVTRTESMTSLVTEIVDAGRRWHAGEVEWEAVRPMWLARAAEVQAALTDVMPD